MSVLGVLKYIFTILLSIFMLNVSAGTYDEMRSLRSGLLSKYDKDVPPREDLGESGQVDVYFQFLIGSILSFDEISGVFKLQGTLNLIWSDDLLKWTPSDHGWIFAAVFKTSDIWYPMLHNSNSVVAPTDLVQPSHDMYISVSSDGIANMRVTKLFETSCVADLTFYPFDAQTCTIDVKRDDLKTEIQLRNLHDHSESFIGHGPWIMSSLTVITTEDSGFYIFVSITRIPPMFMVMSMLLPILLLIVMHFATFIVPVSSGERLTFSVTVLLGIAVLMTVVASSLPQVPGPLPMLSNIFLANLCIPVVGTLISIINVTLYSKTSAVPKIILRVVSTVACIVPACCMVKVEPAQSDDNNAETNVPDNMTMNEDRGDTDANSPGTSIWVTDLEGEEATEAPKKKALDDEAKTYPKTGNTPTKTRKVVDNLTWVKISRILDMVWLILSLAAACMVNFMLISPLATGPPTATA